MAGSGRGTDTGPALLREPVTAGMLSLLAAERANVVFSPRVIAAALNVLRLGSRGGTEAELSAALRPAPSGLAGSEPVRPDSAAVYAASTGVWVQAGVPVSDEFALAVRHQESAELRHLDFRNSPEPARAAINHAISRETRGLITEPVPRGAIRPDTRLALTNVIYYKGLWSHPFPKRNTRDEPFYPDRDGRAGIPVRMMRHTLRAGYLRADGYEAALLPYRDSALSFGIVLPAASPRDLWPLISGSGVHGLLADARPYELTIALPRFRVESSADLAAVLGRLGIGGAFGPAADFSGISPAEPLRVGFMAHSAYVDVDEEGTEAAAAVASGFTPIARRIAELVVNRPFIFAIVDMESAATYFLGQVAYPGA
ncbi:MAG TPA: serpin family protein [Trebonia sp.]|nr:serpin family protein [Trebonia sp.]